MSQRSKVKQSRHQWKHKATQRGEHNRYQRKQLARITAERNRATQALKAAQVRLRQLESQCQELVALPKGDVVLLALHLFFVARIGFRAVCRVLSLFAWALGIQKAPCPQTIINWVLRLTIVRIDSARMRRGLPLSQAPFTNGPGSFSFRTWGCTAGANELKGFVPHGVLLARHASHEPKPFPQVVPYDSTAAAPHRGLRRDSRLSPLSG